jgi:catechol 2,3-dioxygenase-like lactoylglutathione lyase family enzyme
MVASINHITFDCADPQLLGRFWADALGLISHVENEPGDPEWYVYDPSGRLPALLFITVPEGKQRKNRIHFDLQPQLNGRDIEVETLLTKGATAVADHRRPDGTGWVTMADPEGNEFCVERSASERKFGEHRVAPDSAPERESPPVHSADERTMLIGLLDWYRAGVISKLSNLDDPAKAQVSATRSNTTLNGLVKHLAYVEDFWFTERMTGVTPEPWNQAPWSQDRDWEFTSAKHDSPEDVIALYEAAVARSRAVTDDRGLDVLSVMTPPGRPPETLRFAIVHLLEETARHLGHLDVLRELADGSIGE